VEDKHFLWEVLRLSWDRWARAMTQDHFLSNFATAWRGLPHDERGVTGSEPPAWWVKEYMQLQKEDNQAQGQFDLENSGIVCYFDPDTGNFVMRGDKGFMEVRKGDIAKLQSGLANGRPPDTLQPSNMEPQHASYDLPAPMKANMRRNLKVMEDWARASSKNFPNKK
jgi:hypothetical protein